MSGKKLPERASSRAEIDAFLKRAGQVPALAEAKGRLIFSIDATMSRQPAWDRAQAIQADMFAAARTVGGLAVQLVYFRGLGEFAASPWAVNAGALARRMAGVECRGGLTQLERVMRHAVAESRRGKVSALVHVGDCFEEDADRVCAAAGELALRGVPAFMFHEGGERSAAAVFREIARLTRGVYARFDEGSADQLRALLMGAAIYAAGGHKALDEYAKVARGAALRLARDLG